MPKNKRNAFSLFLDGYYDEERRKGRHISKRIAAEECGPLWASLSKEEREFFYEMAKNKRRELDSGESSCDTKWEDPFLTNLSEERAVEEFLASSITDENDLRHYRLYLIHVNYYCVDNDNRYVPGEIALCEFNLEGGIKRKYHAIIHPGEIPLGYAREAKNYIDDVHGLPYPRREGKPSNLKQISEEILAFMKSYEDEQNNYPPLFTVVDNVKASTNVINELVSPKGRGAKFKVYEIDGLFYWLVNKCATYGMINKGFQKKSLATIEIEKDVFRYCTGISCKFHSGLEGKYQNCSLSYVQRLAYIICNRCCYLLRIQRVPGKHVVMLAQNRSYDCDEDDDDDDYAARSDPSSSLEPGISSLEYTCSSLSVDQSTDVVPATGIGSNSGGESPEGQKITPREDTLNTNEGVIDCEIMEKPQFDISKLRKKKTRAVDSKSSKKNQQLS